MNFQPHPLKLGNLFRRSIGRNLCALSSSADVIWFTDVDYCFGEASLIVAHSQTMGHRESSPLHMPKQIWISYDNDEKYREHEQPHHYVGNEMLQSWRHSETPEIDPALFRVKNQGPCIGGVQIVEGDWAREHGYLSGDPRWQKAVDEKLGFRSCKCDAAFRRKNNLRAIKHDIPNVYRIRHLVDGRDYNLEGDDVGKESW